MGLERLQKVMAHRGVASRRQCEEWIVQGRVQVNGKLCKVLGTKVDTARDEIRIDGRLLGQEEEKVYLILYKPQHVLTTVKDEEGRPTVMKYLRHVKERVYPVGRLDGDSEGLLLMTNDGELANRLMHPRYGVRKVYRVWLSRPLEDNDCRSLQQGVNLDDGVTAPAHITLVHDDNANIPKGQVVDIEIKEGRNRQVRRMFQFCGYDVTRLMRIRFGPLQIGNLRAGHSRRLTASELRGLRKEIGL